MGQLMEIGSVKRIHMNEWKNTGIPFLRARDIVAKFNNKKISDSIYISEETYNSNILKSGKVKKGQLLITGVGTIGIPYLITDDSPLYFKDGNVIWLKNNNYDGNFIFYFFTTNLFKNYLFKITGTGTVGTYTIENAKKTPISIPQIKEQVKIGKLFNILKNLLTLYERKVKLLSQMKKYFLDNLFAEKEYPDLRFKGFTDAWEQRKLETLSEHKGGTSIEKYFSSNGLYKVISIGSYGLNNEYIDQGIRAEKNKITESKLVRSGQLTMVLNDKTANGNLIGRCLLIDKDNEFVVNQRTEIIIPGPDLNENYTYYYLNGPFRNKIKRIAQGGTQIYVNYSSVKKQKINYPSKEEQIKISRLQGIIKNLITLYEDKQQHLIEIKKTLLNTMFI